MTAGSPRIPVLIRKIHLHSGLFLLLLSWVFSLSGIMLNHPQWEISKFWDRRQVQTETVPLELEPEDRSTRVEAVLRKLGISGELESVRWEEESGAFSISIVRPGTIVEVSVNAEFTRAEVKRTKTDQAGVLHMLHTFNGVNFDEPERQRDWFWSSVWVVAMDLLAITIIVWVLSGYYLWWKLQQQIRIGIAVAGMGLLLAAFFLFAPSYLQ